jgi:hypothetical protein
MTQTEQVSVEVGDVVSITDALDRTYEATVEFKRGTSLLVSPIEGEPVTILVPAGDVTRVIMRPSVVRSALVAMVKDWDDLHESHQMFWCLKAEEAIIETGHFEVSGRHNGSGVPRHIEGGV